MLEKGYSISRISRELNVDRKTIRKIKNKIEDGSIIDENGNIQIPKIERKSQLDPYQEKIKELIHEGYSAILIHKTLK